MKLSVKYFGDFELNNVLSTKKEKTIKHQNDIITIITSDAHYYLKYIFNENSSKADYENIREERDCYVCPDEFWIESDKPLRTLNGFGIMPDNGCAHCKMCGSDYKCQAETKNLKATISKNIRWEDCGHFKVVFRPGDEPIVDAKIKDNNIYCISGESTIYEGIYDFMEMNAIGNLEEVDE